MSKEPRPRVSNIPLWTVSNAHVLGLVVAAMVPLLFQSIGDFGGKFFAAMLPGWSAAYIAVVLATNASALYLLMVGWRYQRAKRFSREVTRVLSQPDVVVTEALTKRLSEELHDLLPYYLPTTARINFHNSQLPKVREGECYRVIAPCIASVDYAIAPRYEGQQDVVLRPGLLLIVGPVYSDSGFAFHCSPENPQEFLAENIPRPTGSTSPIRGPVRISIYRYHIGSELVAELSAGNS